MENNQPNEPLTKRDRKELKRQEKIEAKEATVQNHHTKKITRWIGCSMFGVAVIAGLVWLVASQPKTLESDIASRNGLHWHPKLAMYVKGIKQEMPANVGISGSFMGPIHTHEPNGVIHLEYQGVVLKKNLTLGQFFRTWGKDFMEFGSSVTMTVNGAPNEEFENYSMRDGDRIEIEYQ